MDTTSTITVEILKEILEGNNIKLVKELPSKADFQELRTELTGIKIKYDEISLKVVELERRNDVLEDQMEKLLQKSLESNVVVRMPAESNVDMKEKAMAVCNDLCDAANSSSVIEYAHPVSSPDSHTAMIVVKMKSRNDAWTVLRKARNLKGTQIHIHKDLPYNTRRRRNNLLPIVKYLRENFPRTIARLKDDKLIIANTIFTWDSSLGVQCGRNDVLEELRKIFGSNFIFSSMQHFSSTPWRSG